MIFEGPHSFAEHNRRQHERVFVNSTVLLRVGSRDCCGRSVNVSEGGMALRLRTEVEQGKPCLLLFELEGHSVKATAEVVRGDRNSVYGLRFVVIDPDETEFIRRFVLANRVAGPADPELMN